MFALQKKFFFSRAVQSTLIIITLIITRHVSSAFANQDGEFENLVRFETELDSIREIAVIPGMSAAVMKTGN